MPASDRLSRRICLNIAYVGTRYVGWQRQPNGISVQSVLEKVLGDIFDEPIALAGAGRTDAGVHALGQVAHFDTTKHRPDVKSLPHILNQLLPPDIAVLAARPVRPGFHARKTAIRRRYLYRLLVSSVPDPFRRPYVWYYPKGRDLSVARMRKIVGRWIGRRDFSLFTIHLAKKENTTRTLQKLSIRKAGDEIRFEFVADAFLHRMVRRMVAYLVEAGLGHTLREPPYAAPAEGLSLIDVKYPAGRRKI